jgi:hypothetical protein
MTVQEVVRMIRDGDILLSAHGDEVHLTCGDSETADKVFECFEEAEVDE